MGFAIVSFTNTSGGFWISEDFSSDGPTPTWRTVTAGLPTHGLGGIDIRVMCVDPADPTNIQYLLVYNRTISKMEIYKRNYTDEWYKVFDVDQAITLTVGTGPYGDGFVNSEPVSPSLSWICADPHVPGRLYTVYSYYNASYVWWRVPNDHWSLYNGCELMASDDYGETWYHHSGFMNPRISLDYPRAPFLVSNGIGGEVAANNGHVWAVTKTPILFPRPMISKAVKGWMPEGKDIYGSYAASSLNFNSQTAFLKINPHHPWIAYSNTGSQSLRIADHNAYDDPGGVARLWSMPSTTQGIITSALYEHASSDRYWINPDDETDQRILSVNGLHLGYVAHAGMTNPAHIGLPLVSAEALFECDGVSLLGTTAKVGNLISLPDDDYSVNYFTSGGRLWMIPDKYSRSPALIKNFSGRAAPPIVKYGLYVHSDYTAIKGHPYVFSVELGNKGTDDMSSSGERLMGSDSAFNTIQQPELHGRDIKELTPTVHAPWPALAGEAPVSDGEKYVATPILTVSGQILRYPSGGGAGEVYDFSVEGFDEAVAEAGAGDRIEITGAGEIVGNLTLAEGVVHKGTKSVIINGTVYSAADAALEGITISLEDESDENLSGVVGPDHGRFRMTDCDVTVTNSGNGDAYALYNDLAGWITAEDCNLSGASIGGDGYAGKAIAGKIRIIGGSTFGSTDNFKIEGGS
jgi:hypothetical protein